MSEQEERAMLHRDTSRVPERYRATSSSMPLLDHRSNLMALERSRSSPALHRFGRRFALLLLVAIAGILFLPWRQYVAGTGRVIAFDPLERSVAVEAPLSGRVQQAFVVEGQRVRQSEVLFEIADNDPHLQENLRQQLEAGRRRRDAVRTRIAALESQLGELQRGLPLTMEAARTRVEAARIAALTAAQQYDRIKGLHEDPRGLASQRDFELARLDRDRTAAEQLRAEAEQQRTEVDLRAAIQNATAQRESAQADFAAAEQSVVAAEIAVNQSRRLQVVAPRDGVVFRVQSTEGTFLRAGSPLCTIIAETENRMAEIWLSGNDMPIVQPREVDGDGRVVRPGSPVRLQFEGWPAIQIIGWPSVARGTFGGEVVLVDPTDDGKGKFRILVAPKPDVIHRAGESREVPWPHQNWLRQGVRVNGWVMLERVPLWWEVWRQLNGFPPVVTEEQLNPGK